MKQPEPKNAVWESTRSILENAVIDRRNLRFVAVCLLAMVIDFLAFQVLFVLGASFDSSQIASFSAGALFNFALNARLALSKSKQSNIRWILYCRFLLVALM